MDPNQIALVMSLLHAHVSDKRYVHWVRPYSTLRQVKCVDGSKHTSVVVTSGHYKAKPNCRSLRNALRLVCKFEDISPLYFLEPPMSAAPRRWSEDGEIIPLRWRRLEFF